MIAESTRAAFFHRISKWNHESPYCLEYVYKDIINALCAMWALLLFLHHKLKFHCSLVDTKEYPLRKWLSQCCVEKKIYFWNWPTSDRSNVYILQSSWKLLVIDLSQRNIRLKQFDICKFVVISLASWTLEGIEHNTFRMFVLSVLNTIKNWNTFNSINSHKHNYKAMITFLTLISKNKFNCCVSFRIT